jgi:MFS transporter, DHA3 family, macrolide efflux protein
MTALRQKMVGMRGFTVIWIGQMASMLGSGMTNFALSYWIFQQTGEATALTLALFAFMLPSVLFSPIAGALVDRLNRKHVLIASDLVSGVATAAVLLMIYLGNLELWHIYLANFVAGLGNAFQFPAYSAAVTMMLPKKHYARASGMLSMAGAVAMIMAPAFAAALLGPVGLVGIMSLDLLTFGVAMFTLAIVIIPEPDKTAVSHQEGKGSLWQESIYGFRYIWRRGSLMGLQMVFFAANFLGMFGFAILVPMILARTGNNEIMLASVQSIGAVGGVIGGLLLSVWGGPRRKIHGVLLGTIFASLLGQVLMGVGQTLLIWATAAFMVQFFLPILNGANQAIWQAKVPPHLQGRVFAVRRLIAQVTAPLATLLAGPVADRIFEPAMRDGGAWAASFGWLVGVGPGAGMSLMFILFGSLGALVGIVGYLIPAIREAEERLADHDAAAAVVAAAGD